MVEIVVNCIMHKKEDQIKQFIFNLDVTVKDAKTQICKEFEKLVAGEDGTVKEEDKIVPDRYLLYRTDDYNDPTFAIRRQGQTFQKNNVSSGETIVLMSQQALSPHDSLKLSVHQTMTGFSEDSQFIEDITVSKEMTLNDLKEQLIDNPKIVGDLSQIEPEFIRIREKNSNGFFGKIFKE